MSKIKKEKKRNNGKIVRLAETSLKRGKKKITLVMSAQGVQSYGDDFVKSSETAQAHLYIRKVSWKCPTAIHFTLLRNLKVY